MNSTADERQRSQGGGANEPVSQFLKRIISRVLARSEIFVSGRYWVAKVFLLSVAWALLVSGGLDTQCVYTEGYYLKIEHPLLDVAKISAKNSHDGNLNFRLTVPVVLHVLGLRGNWILPSLTICAICSIIVLACLFAFRVTQDRVCGLFAGLAVASTYTGSFGVIAYYDAIAIAQLALAMLPGVNWLMRGVFVFTAAFTDERALVASVLLLAQDFCATAGARSLHERWLNRRFMAVAGAMLLYVAARLLLIKFAGLSSPNGGNGPGAFVLNIQFLHTAIWYSLEGGWLLVGLALLALGQRRQFAPMVFFVLAILVMLGFGLMIGDVMRSTVFVFPALLVALAVISQNEDAGVMRLYLLLAVAVSTIGGNYNVFAQQTYWFMPLPVVFFQKVCHVLYGLVRPHFPGGPG